LSSFEDFQQTLTLLLRKTIKVKTIMNGTNRSDIKIGLQVSIVLKQDQRSGKLTEGLVKNILTKSPHHPHGIKVRLESGAVGRVKTIGV
jgi:uncharacterized repeat protein (TIGR03833 family)